MSYVKPPDATTIDDMRTGTIYWDGETCVIKDLEGKLRRSLGDQKFVEFVNAFNPFPLLGAAP